ncbi:MAG: halocyanin domain-containing protein [Haloferacaceae archaeon]
MLDRRAFVRGVGSLTLAGALAGCSGGGGGGGEETEAETEAGTETETATATPTPASGGDVPAAVSEYLSDVGNFDGSVADRTGQSEVTVEVGAQGNGGNFAFAPPAVRVDAGTTVVWEWTGQGGQHNVVAESGADFASELVSEAGHTFSQTLDATGVVTYYCEPHQSLGMKGAVVVE